MFSILCTAALGLVLAGCSGGGGGSGPAVSLGSSSTSSSAGAPQAAVDGATLYSRSCATCHGALASSSKAGASAARIQAAIDANTGGMGSLDYLSAAEVQAIATALAPAAPAPAPTSTATPTPTPTVGAPDGAALYSNRCAACHGPLASSTKLGATTTRIQNAISANMGGMGSLSTLTAAEIQAIANALAPVSPTPAPSPSPAPVPSPTATPPSGATLYGTYCSMCHGALATSTKLGATPSRIQGAINSNTGGMGSLSGLSAAEVQAIADALALATPAPAPSPTPVPSPTATPASGATLYTNNCSACHGALASSTKAGATASRIQTAINANTGGMGSLSGLTSAEVQAIADALATVAPAPVPTDGAGLFTMYCASCHTRSGLRGKTATDIRTAISRNRGGMGSLSTLTTTQIDAIATYLK